MTSKVCLNNFLFNVLLSNLSEFNFSTETFSFWWMVIFPLHKLKIRESSGLLFQIYFTVISSCYFCFLNISKIHSSSHFCVLNSGLHNLSSGLLSWFPNWSYCLGSELFLTWSIFHIVQKWSFWSFISSTCCLHALPPHTHFKPFPAFKSYVESVLMFLLLYKTLHYLAAA